MAPLAERMRPKSLEEYIGQEHLVGDNGVLVNHLKTGRIPSLIFWGPPGVGKTTLARIIAEQSKRKFYQLSAINSGVKDIRNVIESAKKNRFFDADPPILFIDEIHRFSKSQQDALLGAVEDGTIVLIGATTENPSFEVISALLSRSQVYTLEHLTADLLREVVRRAITEDIELKKLEVKIVEDEALLGYSGGDARKLLNILEMVIQRSTGDIIAIDNKSVELIIQNNTALYDKGGEMHYDTISAFIKSVRGSDPNAAVYYLARMIAGGEDPKFICRRLIILASEDIGLANPNALLIANACMDAVQNIGMPEGRIVMSQCTIYLSLSPKSNSAYMAINYAMDLNKKSPNATIPLHLRNAPTSLMKDIGYGTGYQYAHDGKDNFVKQDYLPENLQEQVFYLPGDNPTEGRYREKLRQLWKEKYE